VLKSQAEEEEEKEEKEEEKEATKRWRPQEWASGPVQ
jgi:hypothetical protein